MRIYKSKQFGRFARKSGISNSDLCKAVFDANRGLVAADLGGEVVKQRIARRGSGKSGGFRTLILLRIGVVAIFVHGFAKNEKDNIDSDELIGLKKLAALMLNYSAAQFADAVRNGTLVEVICDGEN